MKYQFPKIEHIDEVMPLIEGRPEFRATEKDGYTVIGYHHQTADTFPYHIPELRELRGICFGKDGSVIRRPYHKFFNIGERPAEELDPLNPSDGTFLVLEKLDGSMIAPMVIDGYVRLGTKAGITDVAMDAEVFVAKNPRYMEVMEGFLKNGFTPIFEWCSRSNRVVIDHPLDRLVLTGGRNIITGEYVPYERLLMFQDLMDIDIVESFQRSLSFDYFKKADDMEGVVIRYDNGHMLKLKSEWYTQIHKCLDGISFEKDLLKFVVDGNLDDILPYLTEDVKKRVQDYAIGFWEGVLSTEIDVFNGLAEIKANGRKSFALENKLSKMVKSVVFDCLGADKAPMEVIKDRVRANLGSQTSVDKVRVLWDKEGLRRWKYRGTEG